MGSVPWAVSSLASFSLQPGQAPGPSSGLHHLWPRAWQWQSWHLCWVFSVSTQDTLKPSHFTPAWILDSLLLLYFGVFTLFLFHCKSKVAWRQHLDASLHPQVFTKHLLRQTLDTAIFQTLLTGKKYGNIFPETQFRV